MLEAIHDPDSLKSFRGAKTDDQIAMDEVAANLGAKGIEAPLRAPHRKFTSLKGGHSPSRIPLFRKGVRAQNENGRLPPHPKRLRGRAMLTACLPWRR